jgi:hypothetical protein
MEAKMSDEFAARAAQLAVKELEDNLIAASREYEDAQRSGDEYSAAFALKNYSQAKRDFDALTQAGRQQQSGQLRYAQINFLSRRQALGDELSPQRMKDYALAHTRAMNAGLEVDSPQYFAAVERSVDGMGDGRQAVLDERSAAKLCGVSDEVYAANAQKLRAMKARGEIS